jgi:TonB family protein
MTGTPQISTGISLLVAIVLSAASCAGAEPPRPPVAITSHAVSAADYPPESVKAGEQGATTVRYVVLEDGTVGDVQVLTSSGYPALDQAAVAMVKSRWRFKPAMQDGKPVRASIEAKIAYVLRPMPSPVPPPFRSVGTLDDVAGHWTSVDSTKYLTGDIDVSSTAITFQNGKTIQLEFVRDRPGTDFNPNPDPAGRRFGFVPVPSVREFHIVDQGELVLLNNSGLCGIPASRKATYVTVSTSEVIPFLLLRFGLPPDAKYQGLFVSTYFGPREPNAWPDEVCTGLAYVRPEPGAADSAARVRNSSLAPMLKSLRWGMPEDDVKRVLPDFVSSVDVPDFFGPGNATAQSAPGAASVIKKYYPYRDCTFTLSLNFLDGRLSGIDFVGLSVAACGSDIAKEINEIFERLPGGLPPQGNGARTFDRLGNETTSVLFSHGAGGAIVFLSPVSRSEVTEGTSPVE